MNLSFRWWACGSMAFLGLSFCALEIGAGPAFPVQASRIVATNTVKSDAQTSNAHLKGLVDILNQCIDSGSSGNGGSGHITVKMPASSDHHPTLDGCPQGTTISGTDSVGTVTIGPGGGSRCEVVFGTPFDEPPTCLVSDNMAHPTPKRIVAYEDHFEFEQVAAWNTTTKDFSGQVGTMLGGEKVSYLCVGYSK